MIDSALYVDGKVVLRYSQPVPKYINVAGNEYICNVQHGVSLLFVEESEVPPLLEYKAGCCGGEKKMFSLASQMAYNVWSTGDR